MKATTKITVNPQNAVPDENRVEWIEKHGVPPASAEIELTAELKLWKKAGARIDTDASVNLNQSVRYIDNNDVECEYLKYIIIDSIYDIISDTGTVPSSLDCDEMLQEIIAKREAYKEKEQKEKEEQLKKEEEEKTLKEKKQKQFETWVEEYGTKNQKERYNAGLLPPNEILTIVADKLIFLNLSDEKQYEKMTAFNILHDEECDSNCDVTFSVKKSIIVTSQQWKRLKYIKKKLNRDAICLIKEHIAETECDHETVKYSIYIKINESGYDFIRHYECPE